jgi:hypothetical protein
MGRNAQTTGTCSVNLVLFDFGGVIAEEGFRNGLLSIAHLNGLDSAIFLKVIIPIS